MRCAAHDARCDARTAGGLHAALQKRGRSGHGCEPPATGDAAVDAIDADAALQTVSDAQWAPVLQEIRGKAGGPGAVAALRRAVDKYGTRPTRPTLPYFLLT